MLYFCIDDYFLDSRVAKSTTGIRVRTFFPGVDVFHRIAQLGFARTLFCLGIANGFMRRILTGARLYDAWLWEWVAHTFHNPENNLHARTCAEREYEVALWIVSYLRILSNGLLTWLFSLLINSFLDIVWTKTICCTRKSPRIVSGKHWFQPTQESLILTFVFSSAKIVAYLIIVSCIERVVLRKLVKIDTWYFWWEIIENVYFLLVLSFHFDCAQLLFVFAVDWKTTLESANFDPGVSNLNFILLQIDCQAKRRREEFIFIDSV